MMSEVITIVENSREGMAEHGHAWGSEWVQITDKHIEALKNGKMLAWDDGEYAHFLSMEKPARYF